MVRLLAGVPVQLILLADVPDATLPEETADSYEGNALIKARAAVRQTGLAAIADDSGIEVDALGGAPGVRSARFGGPGLSDAGRTALLLQTLDGVPDAARTARYRAVIAYVEPDGTEHTVEGVVEGTITRAPRGTGGFGYDPVFFHPPFGRTFGEVSAEEKAGVSHRGQAIRALRALLGA